MLFSSNIFLFVFLPFTLLGYHVLGRLGRKAVFGWLSLMSLVFYGYWNPKYLLLLLSSIAINFAASKLIERAQQQRARSAWLVAAIAANLGLLFWFKYLFPLLGFLHSTGWLSRDFGSIMLPLGISFFTFTQIAYLVDVRQGAAETGGLLEYVLFVTFFPHLIAGPIIHHSKMMPQFARHRRGGLRADDMAVGLTWFFMGLAKKVLFADRVGPIADALYKNPHLYGPQATWIGLLCYAAQLYFDFSGYSDMAMGLARMFSLAFPLNFNSPYKAASIIDFWQRWHITLTNYITTYLYTPIQLRIATHWNAMGRKTNRKAQATLKGYTELIAYPTLFTLLIAGIWHGAGLQFVIYGLLHGSYISLNHAWRLFGPKVAKPAERNAISRWTTRTASVLLTFAAVLVSQIFFRAQGTRSALYVLGTLLGLHHGGTVKAFEGRIPPVGNFVTSAPHAWALLAMLFFIVWTLPNTQEILGQSAPDATTPALGRRWLTWRPNPIWALATLAVTAVTLNMLYSSVSFLYFQF